MAFSHSFAKLEPSLLICDWRRVALNFRLRDPHKHPCGGQLSALLNVTEPCTEVQKLVLFANCRAFHPKKCLCRACRGQTRYLKPSNRLAQQPADRIVIRKPRACCIKKGFARALCTRVPKLAHAAKTPAACPAPPSRGHVHMALLQQFYMRRGHVHVHAPTSLAAQAASHHLWSGILRRAALRVTTSPPNPPEPQP